MEQLVLMKQLQDTNYYVNVLLLSSASANSLLHLEVHAARVRAPACVHTCARACVRVGCWGGDGHFSIGGGVYGTSVLKCKKGATKRRLLSLNVRYINSHNAQRK